MIFVMIKKNLPSQQPSQKQHNRVFLKVLFFGLQF